MRRFRDIVGKSNLVLLFVNLLLFYFVIFSREDTALLKEGETEKVKHYSALCWCKDKINAESFTAINAMKVSHKL